MTTSRESDNLLPPEIAKHWNIYLDPQAHPRERFKAAKAAAYSASSSFVAGIFGNSEKSISRFILVASVGFLSACVTMPQTRDEFRNGVAAGAAFTGSSSYVVGRSFDAVTSVLNEKTNECLNFRSTYSRRDGYMALGMTIDYNASFRIVNKSHAELTIRHVPRPRPVNASMPEGGFYWMAVDVDRQTADTTNLTFYGPSGEEKIYEAIKGWAKGAPVACPLA